MPESLPPPVSEDDAAEPGWYPDPHSPDLLRWWDGEQWSESDFKLRGDDGIPWWHPAELRDRFGPRTRAGSLFNVAMCGVIITGLTTSGLVTSVIGVAPMLALESYFVWIAIQAWWRT
jgi:Protein of unknown function (DUF2510)